MDPGLPARRVGGYGGSVSEPRALDPSPPAHERWLLEHRLKIALGIAAVEGVAAVAGAIPWWVVLSLAIGAVGLYVGVGRERKSVEVRTVTWIAAVSQVLVVLVPVAAAVVATLAIVVVVGVPVEMLAATGMV